MADMPELPEVTTTVKGLNETLPNLTIANVWSDYFVRTTSKSKNTVKNKKFFEHFKKEIVGEKVKSAERRGKNILIHLTNGKTILIHMKMTGHLLYGKYEWSGTAWKSEEKLLADPFNQFIHFIVNFKNGKSLAFSDMRKFAKVTLFETDKRKDVLDLAGLGPEPLDNLSIETFTKQLNKKPGWKIKTTLMDQTVLAGIGNIYSDEILWASCVHPERTVKSLTGKEIKEMWKHMKLILADGIGLGGDSMSDYRNIHGEKGQYQNSHKAYRRTKLPCLKKGCGGVIIRKIIGGRSSHFCTIHQK